MRMLLADGLIPSPNNGFQPSHLPQHTKMFNMLLVISSWRKSDLIFLKALTSGGFELGPILAAGIPQRLRSDGHGHQSH